MNFSERIQNRIDSSDIFFLMKKWIAKEPSSQAATETKSWLPHYRSAREAKIILFLGLFIHDWETWEIVTRIKDSCYYQKYQGEWSQVQGLLEQDNNLQDYIQEYLEYSSEDDFFGNFLIECENFLKRNYKTFRPVERDRGKPRRLVYRRAYKDKGSLRPYHQRGRVYGESSPGEDRRQKVRYAKVPFL